MPREIYFKFTPFYERHYITLYLNKNDFCYLRCTIYWMFRNLFYSEKRELSWYISFIFPVLCAFILTIRSLWIFIKSDKALSDMSAEILERFLGMRYIESFTKISYLVLSVKFLYVVTIFFQNSRATLSFYDKTNFSFPLCEKKQRKSTCILILISLITVFLLVLDTFSSTFLQSWFKVIYHVLVHSTKQ